MKNIVLPLVLLVLSYSLCAQDDDFYCTCQETQQQEAEIFDFVSSMNTQLSTMIPQTQSSILVPQIVDEPEVVMISLPVEEPEPVIEEEPDLEDEMDRAERAEQIAARKAARKGRVKHLKKHKRVKLKKRKKLKKYKGKCPFF